MHSDHPTTADAATTDPAAGSQTDSGERDTASTDIPTDARDTSPADSSATVPSTPAAPLFVEYDGRRPQVHPSAFIAPGAVLIGDVRIGPNASVFYGAVLRADIGTIRVGARTNIQDNCVLHVESGVDCVLGDDVTVGHKAMIHASTVGDGTLVGMSASLLSRSVIGPGSLIAAGAVVKEDAQIPARSLAAGVPARVMRELSPEQSGAFIPHAAKYVRVAREHRDGTRQLSWSEVLTDGVDDGKGVSPIAE